MRLMMAVAVLATLPAPTWGDGPTLPAQSGGISQPPTSAQVAIVPSIAGTIRLTYLDADSRQVKCSDLRVSLVGPGSQISVGSHNFPDPSFGKPAKPTRVRGAADRCRYSLEPTADAFGKSLTLSFVGPVGFSYLRKPLGWQNPIVVQKGFDTKDVEISVSLIH